MSGVDLAGAHRAARNLVRRSGGLNWTPMLLVHPQAGGVVLLDGSALALPEPDSAVALIRAASALWFRAATLFTAAGPAAADVHHIDADEIMSLRAAVRGLPGGGAELGRMHTVATGLAVGGVLADALRRHISPAMTSGGA